MGICEGNIQHELFDNNRKKQVCLLSSDGVVFVVSSIAR